MKLPKTIKKLNCTLNRIMLGVTLLAAIAATPAFARAHRVVDDNDTVPLHGNVHRHARPEFDRGATESSLPMEHMILSLRLSPDKQPELERLLSEQQDQDSANYHHWLTPEEFGERFGPKQEDIGAITGWLTHHGFTIEEVSRSRTSINFSGPVSKVERAFHTSIHDYLVDGHLRHANSRDPAIPRGIADLVGGVVSLHSFPRKMMNSGIHPLTQEDIQPNRTSSGGRHSLSPGDFATIYNINPLYAAGIDGTSQSIAIVGRTHPSGTNWTTFRSSMGLPANPVQVIVNGTDPGDLGADEDGEADLDVEWAGAVAKNATIKFVISQGTAATDGVDLSAQYIVNNNLAPVMSTSFGSCESLMGSAENSFYNNLWKQAAAQGITSFVSSGDSGAAGCSDPSADSGSGPGVNGLASTPYNVAVGGTQFNDGGGGYWNLTNGTGYTSAIGYIPETAWNESGNVSGGSGLWATGGGASLYYAKPSWQVAPGVPADGRRNVPDVSLTAAGHDGYLVQTQGSLHIMSGTSASSPSFAGLMALIVQKTGQRQGNANIRFYQLGKAQYDSGGVAVFHDITSGNNSVPGVVGYSSAAGYNMATGLGSVDANALVNNWAQSVNTQIVPTFTLAYTAGANGTISGISPQTVNSGGSGSPVTAVANPGFHFVSWSDGVTTPLRNDTKVTANISVTASFAVNTYTLAYTAGANGTISGISPQTVNSGGSGSQVTAVANPGYHFVSWSDGVTTAARTDAKVTASIQVTASFAINSYTIGFAAGANGSLTGTVSQSVNYSASASPVTAVPAAGYYFVNWTGDNGFVASAINPLTVSNVTASQNITANFAMVDGILIPAPGKTKPDISDAIRGLSIALGQITPTANDLIRADIAPLGANNKPKGDGVINIYDVIGILRMAVGLI
ncbi:MAG TPA: protease pro-enzyme activation domain-containing protein [Dongiaceae bacterium]|nr:protease pro-enzyme activation domain-containing protein [Dongiaceae bacterium]